MKRQSDLLLSVFAYLYQVGGIPYFTEGFLAGEYEMIEEWYNTGDMDYDEEDYLVIHETYRLKDYYGKKLLKSINHKYHLQQFESTVRQFKPACKSDMVLHEASLKLLAVYEQYPSRSIMDNIYGCPLQKEEDVKILPEEYISFMWDGKGMLYDQLIETVNAHFQETVDIDEPAAIQFFDTMPEKEHHELGFEEQFFECLHILSDFLNGL